ncbi:hypothetical protein [Anabaena azotica]|uniref:Uncharacterized protein n=1 Tax=Anabaena azotica FACHB-119 TaxID=947527 RepID=A0ABR8DE66_9NOST|nr:hypothetical protein [Anabaena azotica]MBD2505530.1 hypothetical protein [Anabaena azotica FACHB-119]
MSSSLVSETITTINRDSGLSHNQMAYRLALMMEKFPPSSIQSTPVLDSAKRDNIISEMRNTLSLSHNAQTTEEYRRSLKDKYLQEYRQKFGLTQTEKTPLNNSTRVENLVNERKKTFLQQMLQSKGRKLHEVDSQQPTKESQNHEVVKKSLIPALMKIIVTRGIDTTDGRVYDGKAYRLQLLMQQGMQLLSVWRKNSNQSAFTAQKDDNSVDYKVTHNDLSNEETDKLINFDQKQRQQEQSQPPQSQPQQQQTSPDGPEMD